MDSIKGCSWGAESCVRFPYVSIAAAEGQRQQPFCSRPVAPCSQRETHKLCSLTATLSCCCFCNLSQMSFLDFLSDDESGREDNMKEASSKPFPWQLLLWLWIYCRTPNILKYGNTWELWLEPPFSTWDYNQLRLRLALSRHWPEASPQQHPFPEISGPPAGSPAPWLAPTRTAMLPGAPPAPPGLSLPSPAPRGRSRRPALPRRDPRRWSARRVPRSSQRRPRRQSFLPLLWPPSEGKKLLNPLSLRGFSIPEGADGVVRGEGGRRRGPSSGRAGAEAGEGLPPLPAPGPALPDGRSYPGTSPARREQQFPRWRRGKGNLLLFLLRCPRPPISQMPPNEVSG